VVLKGPFSIFSGYGQDGFGLLRALMHWGCDVYPQPTWLDVPIPKDLLHLFTKSLAPVPPYDLVINHWSPGELNIRPEVRECTRLAVAWTMWEFSGCPLPYPIKMRNNKTGREWDAHPKSALVPHCGNLHSLSRRLSLYDLVIGYTGQTIEALEPYIRKARKKEQDPVAMAVLQGGYEASEWQLCQDRDWFTDEFTYLMHGALGPRKNPWGAIQAFNELKHEQPSFAGARLACHTMVPGLFPEMNELYKDKKIKVYMEAWDHQTMQSFYNAGHVLLSPSRGEGKNLPALEMMTTGGAVAVTKFSGHMNWFGDAYAYGFDYELGPTWPGRPDAAYDAKVSVEEIKRVIWHTFTHREEVREKASLAAQVIPQMCDWSVVVENLFRTIRDNVPFNGTLIYDMAMRARKPYQQVDLGTPENRGRPFFERPQPVMP
jgi:glycosyltransferase involved in cell wall biosynthesis